MSAAKRQQTVQSTPGTSSAIPDPGNGFEGVFTRTAVALEYASLRYSGHCPLGIYVIPSSNSIMVWDAVLFVHQGYYAGAVLKFRLRFPDNYPEAPPAVDFITDTFHPLIGQNGSFNLSVRFRPWKPKEHHVFDVLHWVKAAFKKHALDQLKETDCLNKEAYRLYHEATSSFAALATQTTLLTQSESALFDRDHPSPAGAAASEIVFEKLDPEQLQKERARLGLNDWESSPASR